MVAITLLLAVPAGYTLARLTGSWGQRSGIGIFLTYLVPPTILFIPLSRDHRRVSGCRIRSGRWSWSIRPSRCRSAAWLMMGFFKAIPRDIEDAAMMDGLSRLGAFIKVVVPISLSGILTVVIFSFTLVLQEFVYAITFISSVGGLYGSVGRTDLPGARRRLFLGLADGGCFIASVPIAILYNFFVDRFIAGFTVGALK